MFDKLIRKGKKMAGDFVREQLDQRGADDRRDGQRNYDAGSGQHGGNLGGERCYGRQKQGERPDRLPDRAVAPEEMDGVSREDQAAIAKYRYMLRTAPPEDMERAHAEAFSRLTPQQRSLLQTELSQELPATERPASDQPQDLARAATRAEVSRPGFMEQILRRGGSGRPGMGGIGSGFGAGLLGGVAGAFIGTAIAGPLLDGFAGLGQEFAGAADGLSDGLAGAGDELSAAGEGLTDQAGGMFGGLFGGDAGFEGAGGAFGEFGGDGGGFGDFEL
ncbi:hypothetical protein [Zhihengliuella halotolerans]|uniref:hypothetical protein n=1 Tax=Zhihengliuella halotolerans TaxID=370736 RepID=UPI000C80BC04|nr:hypothetical protein [Zhihengliuella halotolerans]